MQPQPAQKNKSLKVLLLLMWTLILAVFTAVLSAAPLKAVRTSLGSALFWVCGGALTTLAVIVHWYPIAFVIGAQTVLVGAFVEFEEHGFTLRQSSIISVLIATLSGASSFYLWSAITKHNWFQVLTGWISEFLTQAANLKVQIFDGLKPETLVYQIPSAIVIFLMLSLAFALIFERMISKWAGLTIHRKEKLTEFSNPDILVWVCTAALLGAFLESSPKPLQLFSLNVLNISILAYFFQGLGVLGTYFESFRVGLFWRTIWILILVIQLPILLSLVGIVDYWADFRRFFVRKAAEIRKKRLQE
jgi:hypothetical protein